MKAVIVAIGNELLNGHTVDSNSAWLGLQLNMIGVQLIEATKVPDDASVVLLTLEKYEGTADLIITTGGLGPTKDDLTKNVLADFLDVPLVFNPEMYQSILDYFNKIQKQTTEWHKYQCYLPQGATLMTNSKGTAPGMLMVKRKTHILSLPGVPYEMKSIMMEGGLDWIEKHKNTDHAIHHYIIQTTGIGETHLSNQIQGVLNEFPSNVSIAYLPGLASVKLRITAKGKDSEQIIRLANHWGHKVEAAVGRAVYGLGETTLAESIGVLCLQKKVTIGTAESCTGGYVAHLITTVPGCSAYFKGSVVSYSNDIKMRSLQVRMETLIKHGAVSEETVIEMVKGLLDALEVDVAVAISGIAGPSGGSPEKPVGTVWIAVGNRERVKTLKTFVAKNRELNIKYAAVGALNEMRLFLEDL